MLLVLYSTLKSRGHVFELCCFEKSCKPLYQSVEKFIIQYLVLFHQLRVVRFGAEASAPSAQATQVVKTGNHTNDIIDVLIFPVMPLSAVYGLDINVVLFVIAPVFVPLLKLNSTIFVAHTVHNIQKNTHIIITI